MSQALHTAMTGMNAGQQQISVVADNIANMNTVAFKESSIVFQDVWYQTRTSGTAPTSTRGGSNPYQIGIGTQAASIVKNFEPSSMNTTGRTTDMCLQGNGFFTVMSPEGQVFYTRAGNFTLDPNGNLISSNGYKVCGINSDISSTNSGIPVMIPQALEAGAQPQPAATFADKMLADLNDASISDGTFYIDTTEGGLPGPTLEINVANAGSVQNMVDNINTQLEALDSTIVCSIEDGQLCFSLTGGAGTVTPETINFRAGSSNFVQETELSKVVDSGGGEYRTKVIDYMVRIEPINNLKDALTYQSFSVSETGVLEVTYSNGDKITVTENPSNGAKLLKYTTATGVEIIGPDDARANPVVLVPENLQMQFATVRNPEGLVAIGTNLYTTGPNSGPILYGSSGGNGIGPVKTGGLEASNVDLARQFSNMIMAQRAIEANSRVFDTGNSILQTLVYLGR